ncbi:LuxR family transcriptional regulator [Streptomyces wedmorensis]|uniref:helix-turn-helix transcriptional regulator n=1 Tax=Streptomyces wedmorensis TaxID=43759 RepID=UPI00343DE286
MTEHALNSPNGPAGGPLLIGRTELLVSVEARLAAGQRVLLTGPSGIGKSAVLDALAVAARHAGGRVLQVTGAEHDRWMAGTALADLLRQIPHRFVRQIPGRLRAAVDATALRVHGGAARGGPGPRESRLAWQALLEHLAAEEPTLLLLDNAQWIDTTSSDILAYATRRLAGDRFRVVAAARPGPRVLPDAEEIPVPPLTPAESAELLAEYALPERVVNKLHADSGGNPFLALALAGAFGDRPTGGRRPVPLPPPLYRLIAGWLGVLPTQARATVLTAALAGRPTVELLRRAGREHADVVAAAAVGLLVDDGGTIRFTPPTAVGVVADLASAAERARAHLTLATVVSDAASRVRHRALASSSPDAALTRSLVTAAETACRNGARALGAELYLLAADRTPADRDAERLEWLVCAAEVGAAGALPDIVHRAADAVLGADAQPSQRVRVRQALIDLSGQALAEMDEVFAGALVDAGDDPALLAPVRLRLSWAEMIKGKHGASGVEAASAAALARTAGDATTEAIALTMKAIAARVTGRRAESEEALDAALALPDVAPPGLLHVTPRFNAARFAFFEDRLLEARTDLLRMLAHAERGLDDELVVVLRSVAEVSARMGRCGEAFDFADRAVRVVRELGTSPGPAWYTRAVAELAGGRLERATAFAEHSVRASEQEQDTIFLGRGLHVLGQALMRSGDVPGGVAMLERVRDAERAHGMQAPVILRWHADLATGLARLGRTREASELIAETRTELTRSVPDPSACAVTFQLHRAQAVLRASAGDLDDSINLLDEAEHGFSTLGQPLEQGECLLVRSAIERRRRRSSPARQAASAALALFTGYDARPWRRQAADALERCDTGRPDESRTDDQAAPGRRLFESLTPAEEQIAVLVGEGATNREVAAHMFLSAKTVENHLTRVYRKLGVRSRTQLGSLLHAARE